MIRIGQQAPDTAFEAYTRTQSQPVRHSLAEFRGEWLVLFFYPRDFTFVCPTEIQSFAELEPEFVREGAALLGASTDSYYTHKAWYEFDPRLRDVSFPVIADTSHDLARSFGVLTENGAALRGTFILDPAGMVRHIQVNDLDVGRNPEETLRTLQALRTGQLCPVSWRPGQSMLSARTQLVA